MYLYSISDGLFRHGGRLILSEVSFSLSSGDLISLSGPSGIGKTTFLELLCGLSQWEEGNETVCGSRHYQPQQDFLLNWLTIEQNLSFSGIMRPSHLLALVGLEGYGHTFPSELSKGMRQRVAFLRTLFSEKSLLLFDEPFSHLDPKMREQCTELLLEQARVTNAAVVLVSHDPTTCEVLGGPRYTIDKERLCLL